METHQPVMLGPVLGFLEPVFDRVVVDCTLGLAGHSKEIAARLRPQGRLIALDRDEESLERARENLAGSPGRIDLVHARFSSLRSVLDRLGIDRIGGLVIDAGVSRYQLTSPDRGFSFESAHSADMRMSRSEDGPTAADIVNFSSEEEIAHILWELGEERRARRVARAIVRARPVRSTQSLADIIESVVPRTGRVRASTRSLQALRMYVNSELDEIAALLESMPALLEPGARAVFITFHSLEDRPVKRAIQAWRQQGLAETLTKHVVTPDDDELRRNPASRSAKLRALEWRSSLKH